MDVDTDRGVASSFSKLPRELVFLIVDYACRMPALGSSPLASSSSMTLDRATCRSVAQVSPGLYSYVAAILYSEPDITTPSQLTLFFRSIAANPSLGRLVKALWVGSVGALPDHWWPLGTEIQEDYSVWHSSLSREELPDDVEPGRKWFGPTDAHGTLNMDYNPTSDLEGKVATYLFGAIQLVGGTGISVDQQGMDMHEDYIGDDAWTLRVFEVQAGLDELLRQEKRHPDLYGQPPRYKRQRSPSVDAGETVATPRGSGLPPLTDDATGLMSRPRFPVTLDRFDSPLLYARSGQVKVLIGAPEYFGADGEEISLDTGGDTGIGEDEADGFSIWGRGGGTRHAVTHRAGQDMTVGSVLATLRGLLSMTPYLEHLGLNGFLERAVAGTRGGTQLLRLKTLSLGPPPAYWNSPLDLTHNSLASVEHLHISGCMLFPVEARAVAGHDGALPSLKLFHWTMWAAHTFEHNLESTLQTLLGETSRSRPIRLVVTLHESEYDQIVGGPLASDPRLRLKKWTVGGANIMAYQTQALARASDHVREAWQAEVEASGR